MHNLMHMLLQIHWIDAAIVIALCFAAFVGARRGIIRQTMKLMAFVAAFYLSLALHEPFDTFVRTHLASVAGEISRLQSFVMVYLLTSMCYFVGKCLVVRMVKGLSGKKDAPELADVPNLARFDRCIGAGIAVIAMIVMLSGGLTALGGVEDETVQRRLAGSKLKPHVIQAMNTLLYAVPEKSRGDFRDALDRMEKAGRSFLADLATDGFNQGIRHIDSAAGHVELANRTVATLKKR